MSTIIPLANVDPAMVEQLLDRAFEPERHRRTAYVVREGMDWLPALSFAALDDEDMLCGTIQCWPVALNTPEGRAVPLVMVGPVAVLPAMQNEGFGKMLMLSALQALRDVSGPQGALPQVLIGDPEYYGRFFGFTAAHTGGWVLPGEWEPARLLCRADNPAVLPEKGVLGPWGGAARAAAG
ncbi:N-acetyltransferase [uncultured Croceicoccus sp.]|uniref:GNAT family N-acetyltransferase n=1 Tax=uncultured Croceicoccus sp. TaxID=1295329 RepID=UPI00261ED88B|nr:N-acetyltransferase [uncultured Croceicoccus sp.]